MSKWKYRNKVLNKVPDNAFGFVYLIDFGEDGYYIGSKQLHFRRRKLRTKKDKATDGNNRLKYKEVFTESDWKEYNSSSKAVHTLLETKSAIFIIMSFHETKVDMLLKEAYLILKQFINKDPLILNEWVSIKTRNQYGK